MTFVNNPEFVVCDNLRVIETIHEITLTDTKARVVLCGLMDRA
jgi:hypothetical protein